MLRMNSVFDGCKKSENERCIQLPARSSVSMCGVRSLKMKGAYSHTHLRTRADCGVRSLKMKGAYSSRTALTRLPCGVRSLKMKGAYSVMVRRKGRMSGVRGVKMKGAYRDSWDIATKV